MDEDGAVDRVLGVRELGGGIQECAPAEMRVRDLLGDAVSDRAQCLGG